MSKKIPFNVVFASDEDANYPASELNSHGPTVFGWRSAPGSNTTMHDIILRYHKPAMIYKIQLLAHQYLIPEKIELWLHYSPKSMPSTPSSQCFDFLGFVTLSDNAATNYKSRELQSVSVTPRKGTHLKLRFGKAHKNSFNTEDQIALIAVNILGEELKPSNNMNDVEDTFISSTKTSSITTTTNQLEQQQSTLLESNQCELPLISICDDLLFSMYVEESIAEIINEMEQLKAKAVLAERFEYARKLKLCMNALRSAGERLGRYALAKRQAVQQEDFTTAKLRKEQIEIYKAAVFKHLLVEELLEKSGESLASNDTACEVYTVKPILPPAPSLQDVAHALAEAHSAMNMSPKSSHDDKSSTDGSSVMGAAGNLRKFHDEITMSPKLNARRSPSRHASPMSSHQGSLRRRNKSAPRNSYEEYEDRAIPTLRQECQGTALLEADPHRGRSRLNDRERRQAALPILVFGNELVELFYSRQFQDREDALARLRNLLKESDTGPTNNLINLNSNENTVGPNKVARSAAFLLHRAVRDAVYSVFNQATETVRVLFLEYVPKRVSLSEVARCVDRLLPELLAKSGDPSARIHTLAQHTILSIASCSEVAEQHLIGPALSRTVSSATHPRLALSRMQMLEQLILSQGISTDKHSGLTCRVLSECGCSGLHHPAEPIRKVAERILLLVYKVNPRLVRKQLPPDDDITRRNLLYRHLFTEFDKLDIERKQEMLEAIPKNVSGGDGGGSGNSDSRSSPYGTKSPDSQSSPMRRSETRILKSKSGQSLIANGYASGNDIAISKHNGKQQYNEQVKRSMICANSSHRDSNSNSNSESFDDTCDLLHCPFCDWSCSSGVQSQLDRHFWKSCPFLTKCPQCSQVLEVAALNYHLIKECEAKDNYIMCERCTESVHKQLYDLHQMEDYCRELTNGAARCPLCHDDVNLPLDGGWKLHLLNANGCPGNARRRSTKSS